MVNAVRPVSRWDMLLQEVKKEMQLRNDWISILLSRKEGLESDVVNHQRKIRDLRQQLFSLAPTEKKSDNSGRPVVVHFHIFKNAGTTVDWALEKNFGQDAAKIDKASDPGYWMPWPLTTELLAKKPNIKSISSHQFKFPLQHSEGFNLLPIAIIRHPIDRALSVYNHAKREKGNDPYYVKARESSAKEFIKFNVEGQRYVNIKNFQTVLFSGQREGENVNCHTLQQAIRNLSSCTIRGTVERLDEMLVVAEEILRPLFGKVDLAYVTKNVSAGRLANLSDRINQLKSQIGDELYQRLEEANKFDFLLHQFADEDLSLLVKQINGFDAKLDDFRQRCKKLAKEKLHVSPGPLFDPSDALMDNIEPLKVEIRAAKASQKLIFPKSESPKVSVIILNYNKGEYTFNCLSSVLRNTEPGTYEVILVDNGSTEEESKRILTKLENVKIVTPSENLGFIRGNNYASKYADGEYLLFLNNDTIVLKGWLEALLKTFEKHSKVGVVGSKLIYPDGTLQEAGSIIWNDGSARGYGRNDKDPLKPEYNFVREVDYCSGASLIVRKDLFAEIGGFNELYVPAYFEDVDLCFAARRKGFKVMYNPFSIVVHYEGVTSTRDVNNPTGTKRFEIENRPKFFSAWKVELEKRLPPLQANVIYASDLKKGPSVLIVDGWVPEPDKSSGDNRSFSITNILSGLGCKVTLYTTHFRESKYANNLRELGIEVMPSTHISIDQFLRARSGYYSLVLINANRMSFAETKHYFYQIKTNNTKIRITLHIDDLYGYCKIIKKAMFKGVSDISGPNEVENLLTKHSLDLFDSSESIFVISEDEKLMLSRIVKDKAVFVIPEMRYPVPLANINPLRRRSNTILYVGGFSHIPNVESARALIKQIFPNVRSKVPDAKLIIVGNVPPPEFLNIKDESIKVTGFVEDLSQFYNIAKVAAAPVYVAGGVKGKIIEALNYRTPVVTYNLGIAGTQLSNGKNIMVAKDVDDFANKIVKLLENKILWNQIARNGRKYFEENNSTTKAEEILREFLLAFGDSSNQLGAAGQFARDFQVDAPLAILLMLYNERQDLQNAFPEASAGHYNGLIEWAAKYGVTIDSQKAILSPYKNWFVAKAL